MNESRHQLIYTQRGLLWVGVAMAIAVGVMLPAWSSRLGAAALAVSCVGGAVWQSLRRPTLILDDEGYRVEIAGEQRFAVRWTEVKAVRADNAEHALHIDCGDPQRSLLSPSSGYSFRWSDRERLYERAVAAAQDRVVLVDRL